MKSKSFKKKLSAVLVFVMLLAMMPMKLQTVKAADATTVDLTAQGYANEQEITNVTSGDVTVAFSKGTNESNAPKYYNSGAAVRVYPNNTMTVSVASGTISKIVITYGSSDKTNAITVDAGTFDTNTWEGSAQSVVFTVGGSSGHRRIAKVEVTLATGEQNTTTPTAEVTDTPSPTPTEEPKTLTEDEILAAIPGLGADEKIPGTQSLTGEITSIDTVYSEQYKNITVTIKVQETKIVAYRLAGGSELKVGDKIKVTGTITNYKGNTLEFTSGCKYEMVEAAKEPENTPTPTPEPKTLTEAEILEAIKTLEKGSSIPGTQSLTGVITSIDTEYSEQYKNITVTIKVQDTEIVAFRMANGSELKVGDKIKVSGTIKNYNGTIEFDSKCTYEMVEAAPAKQPSTGVSAALPFAAAMMVVAFGAVAFFTGKKRQDNQ